MPSTPPAKKPVRDDDDAENGSAKKKGKRDVSEVSSPPAAKKAPRDDDDDVGKKKSKRDDSDSGKSGKSVKKGRPSAKKDMSQFRTTVAAISPASKKVAGNFVEIIQTKSNFVFVFMTRKKNGEEFETFNRPFKLVIEKGLEDQTNSVESPEATLVSDLGIVMICPRRGVDEKPMTQRPGVDYPWICFACLLPEPKDGDFTEPRKALQTRFVDALNHMVEKGKFEYRITFQAGYDYTKDFGFMTVNTVICDKDAVELFCATYPVTTRDLVEDLVNSQQIEDFFMEVEPVKPTVRERMMRKILMN